MCHHKIEKYIVLRYSIQKFKKIIYKPWPICFAAKAPSKPTSQPTNAIIIVPRGGFAVKKNVWFM